MTGNQKSNKGNKGNNCDKGNKIVNGFKNLVIAGLVTWMANVTITYNLTNTDRAIFCVLVATFAMVVLKNIDSFTARSIRKSLNRKQD